MFHRKAFPWGKKEEVDAATFKPSLITDYRDPPLPPVVKSKKKFTKKEEICEAVATESVQDVKSLTYLYDHMKNLCITPEPRFILDKKAVLEKSRILAIIRPPLSDRQKRRITMKKEEWLLLELEEDGFTETLWILKTFFEIEQEMHEAQKYFFDSKLLDRKPLSECPEELEFLTKILKFREYYRIKDEPEKEFSLMVYCALYYEKRDDTWLWIVYELFSLALQSVENFKGYDFGYCEAVIRYLFGRVLLERMNRLDESYGHLCIAYNLSLGKNWSASCITEIPEDLIHKNSAFLIYVIQLIRSEKWAFNDPQFALNCIKDGVQKIINTGTTKEIREALLELAIMYNRIHEPHRAIVILLDLVQEFNIKDSDYEHLCDCYLYLAFCYRRLNFPQKAFEYLTKMLDLAISKGLRSYQAQGLKHLGEYYLSKKMYKTARNHFRQSKRIFKYCNFVEQVEEVAILHGYTKAVIHFPDFCETIVNAVIPSDDDFARLCFWAEHGVAFWKTRTPPSDVKVEIDPDEESQEKRTFSPLAEPTITSLSSKIRQKSDGLNFNYNDVENIIQNKEQGIPAYLGFLNETIHLPGNKEEAIDLSYILNCYQEDEHRYKIIEKIEEAKFAYDLLLSPFDKKGSLLSDRQSKFLADPNSSEEEDDIEEFDEKCVSCLTIKPIMQMKDAKLPNKIYLIDVLNQQRSLCNDSYILTKLPKRRPILIPYSPNLFKLLNSFSSDETNGILILAPYKNVFAKLVEDLNYSEQHFKPHSLLNESVYVSSFNRAGKIAKKDVPDVIPFYNIFKGKMDSIKNRVIEKHFMLTEEANKHKNKEPQTPLLPKIYAVPMN